jgi:hypothetical protein
MILEIGQDLFQLRSLEAAFRVGRKMSAKAVPAIGAAAVVGQQEDPVWVVMDQPWYDLVLEVTNGI